MRGYLGIFTIAVIRNDKQMSNTLISQYHVRNA